MQQNNFDVSWTKIGESAHDLVDGAGACGVSYPDIKSKKMFEMDDDSDNDSRYACPKDFASKSKAADATNPNLNIYNSIEDVRTKETNKDHQYEVVKMPDGKESSGSKFQDPVHKMIQIYSYWTNKWINGLISKMPVSSRECYFYSPHAFDFLVTIRDKLEKP